MEVKIEWIEGLSEFYLKEFVKDCRRVLAEFNMEKVYCKK